MEMKLGGVMQLKFLGVLVILCIFFPTQTSAQVQRQDCMKQLQPCLAYLNDNSKPPDSCCRSLDYVIKSLPECLCSLLSIEGANQAEQAGINVTKAQTLPGRCGQRINPLGCVVGTPNRSSAISIFQSSKLIAAGLITLIVEEFLVH